MLAGERGYVLDEALEPCPIGVPGELYISGHGVALGYRGRPGLTARRFLPDPFSAVVGDRMYATGDRVRWLADGTMEILGRLDHQVKVRGHRVELGEVEDRILHHPAVAEAAVVLREDVEGQPRLVAYVAGPDAPAPDELRAWVREELPDYMVPAAFVAVGAALPRTSNGKIDRRALPAPNTEEDFDRAEYVAPCGPVQEALARIWSEVLRVERVSAHDNFFGLGGDSVVSILVVLRAAKEGIRLLPRDVFQHQTIAELAAVAQSAAGAGAEQGLVTGEAPLAPAQHAVLGAAPESLVLVPRRRLEPLLLVRALERLEAHHDTLRMRFERADGGGWRQRGLGLIGESVLEVADFSEVPDDALEAAIAERAAKAAARIDAAEGPVFQPLLVDCGAHRPQRLHLVAHPLVVDAASWTILRHDLANAYLQSTNDATVALPPKTTAYLAWAARVAETDAAREADFWLTLPASSTSVDGETETVDVVLDEAESRAFLDDAPAAYQTAPEETLLAALALALSTA
ncbi:MAG TPA: condensation domain-containing protein, partial [Longimicrobium sp.]|nr:condensation domain-containing protein [Longimicrobium sp.]